MQSKNCFLMFVFIFLSVTLQNFPAYGEGRSMQVAPNVYVITTLSFSNCGFIVTDEGVVAVDTQLVPLLAREIIKEIKAVTDKPIKYAINTHWHTDHIGGNEAFLPEARIIAHENTRKVIAQRRKDQEEGKAEESIKQLGEFKFIPPDITFDHNMTLYMGATRIELKYLGGGHTGGDIVVYLPKERLLFSGDLFIKGSGLPDYRDDSSIDQLIASLKKIQGLDVDKIICGHMGIAEKKDIQESIDKLRAFKKQVKTYVDAGIPPEKAADSIPFPPGENPFYQQNFKKVIYKVYSDIKNSKQR